MVVSSISPDQSSSALYNPYKLTFITYINDPSHKNMYHLDYTQYCEYKYWCLYPNKPTHGLRAANMKNRLKDFEVYDRVLYHKPYIVAKGMRAERSFGSYHII